MTNNQPSSDGFSPKKQIKSIVTLAVIFVVVYFGSQYIQTVMGKRAAAATGLVSTPLEEAKTLSKTKRKPILVEVAAYWCPACRKLDNEVLSNTNIKSDINEKYIFSRIDFDSKLGQTFVSKYHVRGVPSLLILNENGDVLRWLKPTYNVEEFARQL